MPAGRPQPGPTPALASLPTGVVRECWPRHKTTGPKVASPGFVLPGCASGFRGAGGGGCARSSGCVCGSVLTEWCLSGAGSSVVLCVCCRLCVSPPRRAVSVFGGTPRGVRPPPRLKMALTVEERAEKVTRPVGCRGKNMYG